MTISLIEASSPDEFGRKVAAAIKAGGYPTGDWIFADSKLVMPIDSGEPDATGDFVMVSVPDGVALSSQIEALQATGYYTFGAMRFLKGRYLQGMIIGNAAEKVRQGSSTIVGFSGDYAQATTDRQGRVLLGVRNDSTVEIMGVPFSPVRGRQPGDLFFIGDSITAFTQGTTSTYGDTNRNLAPTVCSQGWPVWAMMQTEGIVRYAGISATGGFTIAQILATHVPNAVAARPTFCSVLAGRNDVVQGIASVVSINNLKRIYQKLRRAGIIPICCTMGAQSGNTDAQNLLRYTLNSFIKSYAAKYGLPLVDFHDGTTDPATGEWYSGYNYDVSHPNAVGAKAMGTIFASAMREWISPSRARLPASNTIAAASDNKVANSLFGTDTSGLPAGWAGTSGTGALGTDAAVKGRVWTLSGAATRTYAISLVAGKRYMFSFRMKTTTTDENSVYITGTSGTRAGVRRWIGVMDDWGTFTQEFTAVDASMTITVVANSLQLAQVGVFELPEV